MKGTTPHLYLKSDLRPAIAHIVVNFLSRKEILFTQQICTLACIWMVDTLACIRVCCYLTFQDERSGEKEHS